MHLAGKHNICIVYVIIKLLEFPLEAGEEPNRMKKYSLEIIIYLEVEVISFHFVPFGLAGEGQGIRE